MKKPNGYWTYDNCYNEAKKYKTKKDFRKYSSVAYMKSCKKGWLKNFIWLVDNRFNLFTDKIDSVYAYEFLEQHAVYVGRTLMRTQKQRDYQHILSKNDTVSKFAKEADIPVPEMKILEDNLTIKEGSEREGYWVEKYRLDGWTILNIAKTGSIGGLGKGKWTYETVKNEALKYKTKQDWRNNCESSYKVALQNNWLKDFDWFVSGHSIPRKWTYETIKEEALKYKTRTEFRKNAAQAISIAIKNNWIDEFDWFVDGNKLEAERRKKWTYETTKSEALKYKSRWDFGKNNEAAYKVALNNKWLDEFFPKTK